jgi:hypothetical protein
MRQHRRLVRERYTRPEKLLLVCGSEHGSRLAAQLAAACGPVRVSSPRLVRSEVEEAELILCAGMDDFIELHRLFPHEASRATLLGLFATPRQIDVTDAASASGHLCEWLSTLPRARLSGLRSSADARGRLP